MNETSIALYLTGSTEDEIESRKKLLVSYINEQLPGGTCDMYIDVTGTEKLTRMLSMAENHHFTDIVTTSGSIASVDYQIIRRLQSCTYKPMVVLNEE